MNNIRKSIFETNSSSSHSITIANNSGILETITPDSNGNIFLKGRPFGWKWEKYNDPSTKAIYCYIDCWDAAYKKDMLREVIIEHTGAKEIFLILVMIIMTTIILILIINLAGQLMIFL